MHFFVWTSWFLLACVGAVVATDKNSGVVEVDMVFPRNDTYAPTPFLPIVFAFQNPELAPFVIPTISFTVWDLKNMSDTVITGYHDLTWTNFSGSDPFFVYRGYTDFNTEGSWRVTWKVGWIGCIEDSLNSPFRPDPFVYNDTSSSVSFTTKNSAQEVDLVAATSNNKNCPEHIGVAINVTNTLKLPANFRQEFGETCAVVASPTPIPNPCGAKIDSAAAFSMSSSLAGAQCRGTNPPVSCPSNVEDRKGTAQQLAVGAVSCFAVALGALGYILV